MTSGQKKLVALLSSSTLALLVACIFLGWRAWKGSSSLNTQAALADPAVRDEIIRRLTASSVGVWDSHNDPEVGRVLQPNLREAIATGVLTQTNALGLRERDFELPKPAGVMRVVILGDSFIQGFGVVAEDRLGVFLERYLAEHARGWQGRIECLHVGVGGWNVRSECAWLRRMLTDLAPDFVLHVLVTNDLDDHMGARGFGGLSSFAPLAMGRADALVSHVYPVRFSSSFNTNYLMLGSDYESRHRFKQVAVDIGKVVPLIRASGGRYLALSHWGKSSGELWGFLKGVLEPHEFAALPVRLLTQEDLFHGPGDSHWSRKGHELVAQLSFALIRDRNLLPELELGPWPEVEEPALAELTETWDSVLKPPPGSGRAPWEGLASLEPARFTDLEWRHIYTGLDAEGQVSPFASLLLKKKGKHKTLRLRGRGLDRPELAGARVRVSVEGVPTGEHELVPGQPFDVRFPLPRKEIKKRGAITVHLQTSDYVYAGRDRQHCISFVLDQIALE